MHLKCLRRLLQQSARSARSVDATGGWAQYVSDVIAAYLSVLEQDLVVARAFQVEMDALGRVARQRRRDERRNSAPTLALTQCAGQERRSADL